MHALPPPCGTQWNLWNLSQVRKSIRLKHLTRVEAFIDSPGQQEYFELVFMQVRGRWRHCLVVEAGARVGGIAFGR